MVAQRVADASSRKLQKRQSTRVVSKVRRRAASQVPEKGTPATPTKHVATVRKPMIKSEEALQPIGLLSPLMETNLSPEATKDLTRTPSQGCQGNRKHLERLRDRVLYFEKATATLGGKQRTLEELDRRIQWINKRELNQRLKEHEELAAVRKRHRAELRREECTRKRACKKVFRREALARETREMASSGAHGAQEGGTSLANSSGEEGSVSASALISSQSESDSDSSDSNSESDFESNSDCGW
ncbi:hypothetical protein DL762_002620 [Monosporascus cannonballus]|uniref:Uncharacterized protein n=1 Tax=Monosporascus cannonballus TaxID=155416 RepID=A0ABY0HFN6_9PEZI|nr:hypothetical protein DL762_002620 [Monosporascus cannonballus]